MRRKSVQIGKLITALLTALGVMYLFSSSLSVKEIEKGKVNKIVGSKEKTINVQLKNSNNESIEESADVAVVGTNLTNCEHKKDCDSISDYFAKKRITWLLSIRDDPQSTWDIDCVEKLFYERGKTTRGKIALAMEVDGCYRFNLIFSKFDTKYKTDVGTAIGFRCSQLSDKIADRGEDWYSSVEDSHYYFTCRISLPTTRQTQLDDKK